MILTLDIPDDLVPQFIRPGQDFARTFLEDAALEAYRMHRLTGAQLRRLLGLASCYELDGLLKARRVWLHYTLADRKAGSGNSPQARAVKTMPMLAIQSHHALPISPQAAILACPQEPRVIHPEGRQQRSEASAQTVPIPRQPAGQTC